MDMLSQVIRYSMIIVLMVPLLGGSLIAAPFSDRVARKMIRAWNRTALAIFGVTYEVQYEGAADDFSQGGVIVGLTQQSLIDPTVGFAVWERPVKAIWNIEYALIPFFGWVSFILGWVIVRQSPSQSKRKIEEAAKYVSKGGLVYLSAEGKRSTDGSLNPYKKGPVVMAIKGQSAIRPMYIAGSRACMPPGSWKIRPGHIVVRYLSPIETKGLTYEDRDDLLAQLSEIGYREHSLWAKGEC